MPDGSMYRLQARRFTGSTCSEHPRVSQGDAPSSACRRGSAGGSASASSDPAKLGPGSLRSVRGQRYRPCRSDDPRDEVVEFAIPGRPAARRPSAAARSNSPQLRPDNPTSQRHSRRPPRHRRSRAIWGPTPPRGCRRPSRWPLGAAHLGRGGGTVASCHRLSQARRVSWMRYIICARLGSQLPAASGVRLLHPGRRALIRGRPVWEPQRRRPRQTHPLHPRGQFFSWAAQGNDLAPPRAWGPRARTTLATDWLPTDGRKGITVMQICSSIGSSTTVGGARTACTAGRPTGSAATHGPR